MQKVIYILLLKSSNLEKLNKNFKKLSKFLKYNHCIKKKKYFDISKWTIKSRRHERHFYVVFDKFSKVIIIMRAYMVPPYVIRWVERRKSGFTIFSNESHHYMQLMSRRHVKYENGLETR